MPVSPIKKTLLLAPPEEGYRRNDPRQNHHNYRWLGDRHGRQDVTFFFVAFEPDGPQVAVGGNTDIEKLEDLLIVTEIAPLDAVIVVYSSEETYGPHVVRCQGDYVIYAMANAASA